MAISDNRYLGLLTERK